MEIREATSNDLLQWTELRCALWQNYRPEVLRDEAEQLLASPNEACFLLIDDTDNCIGFTEVAMHSGSDGPYAHLEAWYVAPDYRGQGYGRRLVDSVEQWCLHRAIGLLTSDTDPEFPSSLSAHERCGFTKIHEFTIFMKVLRQSAPGDRANAPPEP